MHWYAVIEDLDFHEFYHERIKGVRGILKLSPIDQRQVRAAVYGFFFLGIFFTIKRIERKDLPFNLPRW